MRVNQLLATASVAALLAACAVDAGPKEAGGAVVGGVAGGLIGSTIGDGKGQVAATLLGASLGAIVGGAVGRELDDQDRDRAYFAAQAALADGEPEEWQNPESGHRGRFTPTRSYYNSKRVHCRDFEHRVWIEGEPEIVEGTACQQADGSWRVVS
jgi:surface antigen